jgi:hypothetical protein
MIQRSKAKAVTKTRRNTKRLEFLTKRLEAITISNKQLELLTKRWNSLPNDWNRLELHTKRFETIEFPTKRLEFLHPKKRHSNGLVLYWRKVKIPRQEMHQNKHPNVAQSVREIQ